jgi:hypothetical protein
MKYKAKSVDISPSKNGVGYVGQATSDNGVSFNVVDDTNASQLTSQTFVEVAPESYPQCAKLILEEALNAKVRIEECSDDAVIRKPGHVVA